MLAIFIGAPVAIWAQTIARRHPDHGAWRLSAANLCRLVGLAIYGYLSSYLDFSGRIRPSALSEAQRWEMAPGWSVELFLIFLVAVLPAFGLLLTPICAAMVVLSTSRRLVAATALFVAWTGLGSLDLHGAIVWRSITSALCSSLWIVVAIPAPFLLVFLLPEASRNRTLRVAARRTR